MEKNVNLTLNVDCLPLINNIIEVFNINTIYQQILVACNTNNYIKIFINNILIDTVLTKCNISIQNHL